MQRASQSNRKNTSKLHLSLNKQYMFVSLYFQLTLKNQFKTICWCFNLSYLGLKKSDFLSVIHTLSQGVFLADVSQMGAGSYTFCFSVHSRRLRLIRQKQTTPSLDISLDTIEWQQKNSHRLSVLYTRMPVSIHNPNQNDTHERMSQETQNTRARKRGKNE